MKFLASILALAFSVSVYADQFDVPQICESSVHNIFSEYSRTIWGVTDSFFKKSPEEIASQIVFSTSDLETLPWLLQDVSQPNALKAAYLVQLRLAQMMIDHFYPGISPRDILKKASVVPATYSQAALAQVDQVIKSVKDSDPSNKDAYEKISNNAQALCLSYLTLGCPSALRDGLELMDVHLVQNQFIFMDGGANVSRPNELAKFLSDASLVQGFSYFALRLMDNLEGGSPLGKNLFDDLKNSFTHFGISPAQAEENAWTILSFYSTRGASIAMFEGAANRENLPVLVALYAMSTAIGVIDSQTVQSGHAYSYPSDTSGFCKMDRPYHFWMASSLVRSLIKKGHSPKAAAAAVKILGNLYEFGATVMGRDPNRLFKEDYLSPNSHMVRIGLAYNTAGILWASGLHANPLNFDSALGEILKESRPISVLSDQEIEGASDVQKYLWFNKIVAPDAALKKLGPF